MKSIVSLLGCFLLCACSTSRKPVSEESRVWLDTIDQVRAAGLSARDISAVHSFLRHAFSSSKKSSDCVSAPGQEENLLAVMGYFSKKFDPRRLVLTNGSGLRIGVVYSARSDSLWLVDPERLPSYDEIDVQKQRNGYLFTLVQGCERFPVEMITERGRPYLIKFPDEEE